MRYENWNDIFVIFKKIVCNFIQQSKLLSSCKCPRRGSCVLYIHMILIEIVTTYGKKQRKHDAV